MRRLGAQRRKVASKLGYCQMDRPKELSQIGGNTWDTTLAK